VPPMAHAPSQWRSVTLTDVPSFASRRSDHCRLVATMAHRPFGRWLIRSFLAWRERSAVRRRLRRYVAAADETSRPHRAP
jgi:hypothetical protein